MSSKIIIPIAVAISVIVTAGIMYSIGFDQQPQISQIPTPEIVYVDKTVSEYFEGTGAPSNSALWNIIASSITMFLVKILLS